MLGRNLNKARIPVAEEKQTPQLLEEKKDEESSVYTTLKEAVDVLTRWAEGKFKINWFC